MTKKSDKYYIGILKPICQISFKGEHKDFCMLILKDLLDVKKHIVVKKNS